MKNRNIIFFIILLILNVNLVFSDSNELIKRTIFVAPVQYESSNKEYEYLKDIIRDVLISKLSSTRNFSFLNLKEGDKKLEELNYSSADIFKPEKLSDFGIKTGSDLIIVTKYSKTGQLINIELKIYNLLISDFTKTYTINKKIGLEIINKIDVMGSDISHHMKNSYEKIKEKKLNEIIIEKYGSNKHRVFNKQKSRFIGKGKYEVTFKENINAKYEIIAVRGEEVHVFKKYDDIFLEKGEWLIIIKSDSFKETSVKIRISNKEKVIDFTPDYYKGTIVFNNLKTESSVYLNGKNFTKSIVDSKLHIKSGFYYIRILTEDYDDFAYELNLNKDETEEVNVNYNESGYYSFNINNDKNRKKNPGPALLIPGTGLLIIGIGFAAGGYGGYGFQSTVWSGTESSMFGDMQYAFLAMGIVGTVMAVTGIVLLFVSIPFFVKHRKKKVSFNIKFGNYNDLYFSLKF